MARSTFLFTAAAMGLAMAFGSSGVQAHTPSDPSAVGDLGKLAAKSNLIIQGKVKAVAYRSHKIAGKDIPFAYVTYSVTSRLLGVSNNEITLRFIGGPDGLGSFVAAEGVPNFNAGDEDILFVKSNGDNGCPLVMCDFGRFRILNGNVYDGHGQPIATLDNGRMSTGGKAPEALLRTTYPAPSFDELLKNPQVAEQIRQMGLTVEQARAKYAREAGKEIVIGIKESEPKSDTPDTARAAPPAPIPASAVVSAIRSAVAQQRRAAPAMIKDADPAAFKGPDAAVPAAPRQ